MYRNYRKLLDSKFPRINRRLPRLFEGEYVLSIPRRECAWLDRSSGRNTRGWVGSTISRSFIESSVYSLTAEAKIEAEFSSIASRDHFISRNAHAPPPSSPPLSRQLSTRARTRCNTVGGSVADAQAATNPDGLERIKSIRGESGKSGRHRRRRARLAW